MGDGMTIDELRATLALQGWVALEWRHPIAHWGMSKSGVGSVLEDAWDPKHGPSVSPLAVTSFVAHAHEQHLEISWGEMPPSQMIRLAGKAKELGWLSL